jgi:lipoprotein-releasing system ATP-binding protein
MSSATAEQQNVHLRLDNVTKIFQTDAGPVEVLKGVSLEAGAGEAVAVVGPSGCGKSTLLHLVGTLDEPTGGTLEIGGQDPFALPEKELAAFRNRTIGFVFQDHHLLPQYTVLENVFLPVLADSSRKDAGILEERARQLLDRVGLSHRLDHRPAQLSGGERQRVAIARALILDPALVLCDEPTGNLDAETADAVADLLFELHQQEGGILLVITHSPDLAERFPRRLTLKDGRCVEL